MPPGARRDACWDREAPHHDGAGQHPDHSSPLSRPTEVTLRAPAPLETPLEAALRDDGSWELMDGPTVVAVARPVPVELSHLKGASLEEAREAEKNPVIKPKEHLLPMCFVCGPDRPACDGLRIMAGPLRCRGRHGRVVQAASWTPSQNLSADDGLVAAEFVWAALDCPSGYAATYDPGRDGFDESPVLLGRLAACISHRPRAGEGCVVTAWETGREGRKRFAECAAFGEDGRVLAVAKATWIVVDRQVQLGRGMRLE